MKDKSPKHLFRGKGGEGDTAIGPEQLLHIAYIIGLFLILLLVIISIKSILK